MTSFGNNFNMEQELVWAPPTGGTLDFVYRAYPIATSLLRPSPFTLSLTHVSGFIETPYTFGVGIRE